MNLTFEESESDDEHHYYTVQNGDSLASIASKFHLTPPHLSQFNKLGNSHLFAGKRLRVVKEKNKTRNRISVPNLAYNYQIEEMNELPLPSPANSLEIRYRQLFKRILGSEKSEQTIRANQSQEDDQETNDPLASGCLKFEARYCYDIHNCVKGTLLATFDTLMFSPLEESPSVPVEMRNDTIRSVAAYRDSSLFAFIKRPRAVKKSHSLAKSFDVHEGHGIGAESHAFTSTKCMDQSIDEMISETPVLQDNEVFLCCSFRRTETSPSPFQGCGAQWFIVPRSKISHLHHFLIGCDIGLASVFPEEDLPTTERVDLNNSHDVANPLDKFIPRRRMMNAISISTSSPRTYLNLLKYRSGSSRQKLTHRLPRLRRPVSLGSSEELFSVHAGTFCGSGGPSSGEEENIFFGKSTPSTPTFADEKEVFDALRQSSLEWELVSEDEFLLRCVGDSNAVETVAEEKLDKYVLPPPSSLYQSHVLGTAQIQELFDSIPSVSQCYNWYLTFSTEKNGFSLSTLYRRCDDFLRGELEKVETEEETTLSKSVGDRSILYNKHSSFPSQFNQPCVLLIKDSTEAIMGAYMSSHPRVTNGQFYGTGESFVFHWVATETPVEANEPDDGVSAVNQIFAMFLWSRLNSFFISGEHDALTIGCSNASSALRIDEDLLHGRTQPCETFGSPQLAPNSDFLIHTLELWSLF